MFDLKKLLPYHFSYLSFWLLVWGTGSPSDDYFILFILISKTIHLTTLTLRHFQEKSTTKNFVNSGMIKYKNSRQTWTVIRQLILPHVLTILNAVYSSLESPISISKLIICIFLEKENREIKCI